MKKLVIAMMALVVIFTLPLALFAQETDPVAVVEGQAVAINAGDVEAAMGYYADDAVITVAYPPPAPPDVYTGADEVRAWFEELVAMNFELDATILQVDGNTVTTNEKTYSDFSRDLGIAPLEGITKYNIQNGKIKGFTWTMSDESWAKLQAAMPPQSMPESGGTTFPTYAVIITLGGMAILGGLSLALLRRRTLR